MIKPPKKEVINKPPKKDLANKPPKEDKLHVNHYLGSLSYVRGKQQRYGKNSYLIGKYTDAYIKERHTDANATDRHTMIRRFIPAVKQMLIDGPPVKKTPLFCHGNYICKPHFLTVQVIFRVNFVCTFSFFFRN